MYEAEWIADVNEYRCLDLQLASVATLTRAKIFAADVAEFSGRTQDVPDLMELLHHQGIRSMSRFETRYPDPFDEHPHAHQAVREHFAARRTAA